MAYPINFLPWRQLQRTACLRFWSVMFSASLVVICGLFVCYLGINLANERVNTLLLAGEQRRAEVIAASKPRLLARQQLFRQALARKRLCEQTSRWQADLLSLAAILPEQAWLTGLTYQQETLEFVGKALTFHALGVLEAALRRQHNFQISHTGATQQDAQGYWQFQYQLTRSRQNEVAD